MNHPEYTPEEIARRGREIYEQDIRPNLESIERLDGAFLVVDITTGGYFIGKSDDEAFEKAEKKNQDGPFYLMRIGRATAHRIGAQISSSWSMP